MRTVKKNWSSPAAAILIGAGLIVGVGVLPSQAALSPGHVSYWDFKWANKSGNMTVTDEKGSPLTGNETKIKDGPINIKLDASIDYDAILHRRSIIIQDVPIDGTKYTTEIYEADIADDSTIPDSLKPLGKCDMSLSTDTKILADCRTILKNEYRTTKTAPVFIVKDPAGVPVKAFADTPTSIYRFEHLSLNNYLPVYPKPNIWWKNGYTNWTLKINGVSTPVQCKDVVGEDKTTGTCNFVGTDGNPIIIKLEPKNPGTVEDIKLSIETDYGHDTYFDYQPENFVVTEAETKIKWVGDPAPPTPTPTPSPSPSPNTTTIINNQTIVVTQPNTPTPQITVAPKPVPPTSSTEIVMVPTPATPSKVIVNQPPVADSSILPSKGPNSNTSPKEMLANTGINKQAAILSASFILSGLAFLAYSILGKHQHVVPAQVHKTKRHRKN